MTIAKKMRLLIHIAAGVLMIAFSVSTDYILMKPTEFGPIQVIGFMAGVIIILSGFVYKSEKFCSVSTNLVILLSSLLTCLLLTEGFFRIIEFDFSGEERAWRRLPIFYRIPTVPTGEVFFRRYGPETWRGQVLNTMLTQHRIQPNPYSDEPIKTISYDSNGFRNPRDLEHWEIAVTGDSFTELGYLRYEELFTTVMQKLLNVKVLNLGVSHTGPLTQLSYLKTFGISSTTRHGVIVFFEGNDLTDISNEYENLLRYKQTGERDYRSFIKQTSMVRFVSDFFHEYPSQPKNSGYVNAVNAYFISKQGDVPITIQYTPPRESDISPETMKALDYFFTDFVDFAEQMDITPWLVFMPCKRRVLYRYIKLSDTIDKNLEKWQPTNLPELMFNLCAQHQIEFIDVTPVLINETVNSETLVYNSIYDTHLNSRGSLLVGKEIARVLGHTDKIF